MKKIWLSYIECKSIVHALKFNNVREFEEWAFSDKRPSNIPSTPFRDYKKTNEWVNWSDFLGTKLSYDESKELIKSLNIKTCSEYYKRVKELPRGVPHQARSVYTAKKEWISWNDYLSRNTSLNIDKRYK